MGFSFYSTGGGKRPKECWNESHTVNGSAPAAITKEKPAGVNRWALETRLRTLLLNALNARIDRQDAIPDTRAEAISAMMETIPHILSKNQGEKPAKKAKGK